MTTKEEVLRLVEEIGLIVIEGRVFTSIEDYPVEITKLIELAKAQGAEEEREACAVVAWNHHMDTSCKMGISPEFYYKWCSAEAIRTRERKE